MKDSDGRRTYYVGGKRAYIYERPEKTMPFEVKLPGQKRQRVRSLAAAIKRIDDYGKANIPPRREYDKKAKSIIIVCECGCGQTGQVVYTTRKPRFIDDTHKNRYDYNRRTMKREKRMKELLRAQKERRLADKRAAASEKKTPRAEGRREGKVRKGNPGGGVPLLSKPEIPDISGQVSKAIKASKKRMDALK